MKVVDMNIKNKAFTMLELMVVVAIVAITTSMAAPSLLNWLDTLKVQSKGENIISGLNKARAESLKRGVPVEISFDAKGNWSVGCETVNTDVNSELYCPLATIENSESKQSDDNHVAVTFSPSNSSIVFNSLGGVLNSTGYISQIDVSSSNSSVQVKKRVIIKVGGAIKSCNPDLATGVDKC